eukprot:TRINITY_DN41925_c0_g1_i1.p1 TRINITY_DN41925_c0_g1~~TRINITY_DN41925_c0_g1_i1.p1  ORF type:complete len:316 (-),score=18.68 TRINITY_DN41925_c0_g1_i1:302-1138(-)
MFKAWRAIITENKIVRRSWVKPTAQRLTKRQNSISLTLSSAHNYISLQKLLFLKWLQYSCEHKARNICETLFSQRRTEQLCLKILHIWNDLASGNKKSQEFGLLSITSSLNEFDKQRNEKTPLSILSNWTRSSVEFDTWHQFYKPISLTCPRTKVLARMTHLFPFLQFCKQANATFLRQLDQEKNVLIEQYMYHVEEAEAVIVLRKDIAETAFSRAQFMASRWTYLFSNSLQLQTSMYIWFVKSLLPGVGRINSKSLNEPHIMKHFKKLKELCSFTDT